MELLSQKFVRSRLLKKKFFFKFLMLGLDFVGYYQIAFEKGNAGEEKCYPSFKTPLSCGVLSFEREGGSEKSTLSFILLGVLFLGHTFLGIKFWALSSVLGTDRMF